MSEQPTAAEMFAAIDWDARLRSAVEKTLETRLDRLKTRAALTEARHHGLAARHAAKEAWLRNQARFSTPDPVSNPCHSPTEQQVTASSPDPQTGENEPQNDGRSAQ